MSVDSAYFIEKYVADNEVKYIFEFESIGSEALFVYIIASGVRTLLPNTEYSVEFGFRPPIHTRGEITLDVPLSEGEFLQIERQTPITNESVFPAGKPFEANTFEFALDKITFIQQELEGSLCDCRGESSLDPRCVPYACDAYRSALISGGLTYVWLLDDNDERFVGQVITEIGGFDNLVVDGSVEMEGLDGAPIMDSCPGVEAWLVRDNNVANSSQFAIIGDEALSLSGASTAMVVKTRPGFSGSPIAVLAFYGKNPNGPEESNVNVSGQILSNASGEVDEIFLSLLFFGGTINETFELPTPVAVGDPMLITSTMTNDQASLTIVSRGGVNFTASISTDRPYVALPGRGDDNKFLMLTNSEMLVETIGLNLGTSKPSLAIDFARNFTDYTQPEFCQT